MLGVGRGAAVARVARRRVVRWWNCILAGLGGEDVSFFFGVEMEEDYGLGLGGYLCVFVCKKLEDLCVVEIEEN